MKWETGNHIISIVAGLVVILGGSGVVLVRVTNSRKIVVLKDKLSLMRLDKGTLEDERDTALAKLKTFEDTIKAFKEAAKSNPEVAKAVLPFLTDIINNE